MTSEARKHKSISLTFEVTEAQANLFDLERQEFSSQYIFVDLRSEDAQVDFFSYDHREKEANVDSWLLFGKSAPTIVKFDHILIIPISKYSHAR